LLSDVDAATQEYGLAFPVGAISHTGIGGLALGGGMGWLTRRHGLSIDNLKSARVVTADGQVLRAAADESPELFWALRGGGGNFGVVTEFEFRLHEVGPMIQFGMLFWELEQGPEVLRLARETLETLPTEFNIIFGGMNAPPAPFVPEQHHFRPGYGMIVVGFGGPEAHAELVARLSGALPPLVEFAGPMPYVALQQMMDEASAWGRHSYERGAYLTELTDEAIKVVTPQVPQCNSPLSMLLFYRLDGAYSEVVEDATAFGGRRSPRSRCTSLRCALTRPRWRRTGPGPGRPGRRCARTPRPPAATSTRWPSTRTTGSAPPMAGSTSGLRGSSRATTRRTCSTAI
jgi:hypothetical protein